MKLIKKRMQYMLIVMLAGAGMLAAGLIKQNTQMSGMGAGMLTVALLKLAQYFRIMRNPERVKELEIVQNEERLVFLANKSAALTLYALIAAAYIAMLALMLMGRSMAASIIAYVVCGALVIYLIAHAILNKRY